MVPPLDSGRDRGQSRESKGPSLAWRGALAAGLLLVAAVSPALLSQPGPRLAAQATADDPARRGLEIASHPLDRPASSASEPVAGVNLSPAWERSRGDPAVTVAVLDSGIDRPHEDLPRVLAGWDPHNDDLVAEDDCGHGTRVAGILGAGQVDDRGVAGVARASILPVKVLGEGADGCTGSTRALEDAIRWAVEARADVLAIPLGCPPPCWDAGVADAIGDARREGALVVASVGNDPDERTYFPASVPEALAVGDLDPEDASRQPGAPDRGPEILAPGESLATTAPGDAYGRLSGASAAVPVVAGVAALSLSVADLAPDDLARLLRGTARDVGDAAPIAGPGAVDAGAALERAQEGSLPSGPGLGATWSGTDRGEAPRALSLAPASP